MATAERAPGHRGRPRREGHQPALTIRAIVEKGVPAPVPPGRIREILQAAGSIPEVADRLSDDSALTVRLTGDRELRRLNRLHLGEDHATDVLSFPAGPDSLEPGYLGDLAVSWPAVLRQAAEFDHPPDSELALLCVHGLLHLLGWDHTNQAQARAMEEVTASALARVGVEVPPARLRLGC